MEDEFYNSVIKNTCVTWYEKSELMYTKYIYSHYDMYFLVRFLVRLARELQARARWFSLGIYDLQNL